MKLPFTYTSAIIVLAFINVSSQNIFTYAGTGVGGFSGDGGPAVSAQMYSPMGITSDNAGNIYFCDYGNYRIRKIDPAGIITTVVGGGTSNAEGIPATLAGTGNLSRVTVDAAGNIYFSETMPDRIRKVNTSGIINTIIGTGGPGYSGDGGPALSAAINDPYGIAVDAVGNIYFADGFNNRIRKVNTSGIISTVAGTTSGGFSGDMGPAVAAQLNQPSDIIIDAMNNIYISDFGNRRIRMINSSGTISTVAGTGGNGYTGDGGSALIAQIGEPVGIAQDTGGNLYIADGWNSVVRKVNAFGVISTIAGNGTFGYSGDGTPATSAQLNSPADISVNNNGNIFISDQINKRIRIVCVNSCLMGIEEDRNLIDIKLYPNPITNYLYCKTETQTEGMQIEVSNTVGQSLVKIPYAKQVDLSYLSSGCYFVKILKDGKPVYYSRFVKE